MLAAHRLSRILLARASNCLLNNEIRATYIRGYWPEPLSQQTLDEFLDDINYFEEPKKFVNIGLEARKPGKDMLASRSSKQVSAADEQSESVDIEKVLELLGEEVHPPPLDIDDAMLSNEQLMQLAISSGIYRDLFGHYTPDREHIKFTPEQAERLYKLVPHHWITDQPFARAERKRKEPEQLYYFEPVVRISAKFVHACEGSEGKHAHTSHHGNLIPSCEALVKPSIAIDGCWLNPKATGTPLTRESQFNNWEPGQITFENFPATSQHHTILLLNLDSIHANAANLHWMVANIKKDGSDDKVTYQEACDYLPVHGIRGFGYSRYVFLVLQHESKLDISTLKLDDLLPATRKFDVNSFLDDHKDIKMLPVGMSWFQTVWDQSSNDVFHNQMQMRAPVYEHVQQKLEKKKFTNPAYPGKLPFNTFIDHYRDPKDIEKQVLLERLKTVDPFDYKDQYVKPRVPPTVFIERHVQPSWMRTVLHKKLTKTGYWRGLRPASATIPLNNNADLDHPERPIMSPRKTLPAYPNLYPARPRIKQRKDLPYSKPANEHTNVYTQEGAEIYLDEARKMVADLQESKK